MMEYCSLTLLYLIRSAISEITLPMFCGSLCSTRFTGLCQAEVRLCLGKLQSFPPKALITSDVVMWLTLSVCAGVTYQLIITSDA